VPVEKKAVVILAEYVYNDNVRRYTSLDREEAYTVCSIKVSCKKRENEKKQFTSKMVP
jgi:hypothetical protein